ncbi:MAG: TonB family protein [Nitrospiria bacterium]
MKRVVPVCFISILINLFLFLMMHRMVAGEKKLPEKGTDFQEIEFIRIKQQPKLQSEPPREKKRTVRKLPVLKEPPPLKPRPKIAKGSKPRKKTKRIEKIKRIQPIIEPVQPLPLPTPPTEAVMVPERWLEEVVTSVATPKEESEASEVEPARSEPEEMEVAEATDVPKKTEEVPIEIPAPPSNDPEVAAPETVPNLAKAFVTGEVEIDAAPLIRVPPRYPRRAVRAKLEGIVTVAFTITKDGSVRNPTIIRSNPPKVFDRSALRAIRKWKFSPKEINGKSVVRRALQDIRFSLKEAK